MIFRALRDSRSAFGLKPGHLQTLQAMLSFLRPGHGETVFASNVEICRRVGGIDERTLRRHIDRFIELGFMSRHDSPNRKRYRVRASDGRCISFGLSLSPLMERAQELLAIAQELENERRDRIFLRKQILTTLALIEATCPDHPLCIETRKILRRKLSVVEYRALQADIQAKASEVSTAVDTPKTTQLPANDGQTDRHHSKSEKIQKDLDKTLNPTQPQLETLLAVCDQAAGFAVEELTSWSDVETHAQTLAPMMGIHPSKFADTRRAIGDRRAACAIFIVLQMGKRIRNLAAYFHSITIGRKSAQFDPARLLRNMAATQSIV